MFLSRFQLYYDGENHTHFQDGRQGELHLPDRDPREEDAAATRRSTPVAVETREKKATQREDEAAPVGSEAREKQTPRREAEATPFEAEALEKKTPQRDDDAPPVGAAARETKTPRRIKQHLAAPDVQPGGHRQPATDIVGPGSLT